MRSLRISPDLEERLKRAAAIEGTSVSEFIRRAAADRADDVFVARRGERFADVIGIVHGGGGRARRTGDAFAEALADRHHAG